MDTTGQKHIDFYKKAEEAFENYWRVYRLNQKQSVLLEYEECRKWFIRGHMNANGKSHPESFQQYFDPFGPRN